MRSQLTRNVYRRLLAGHGLLRPCPAGAARCLAECRAHSLPQLVVLQPSRRTFLNVFKAPPREVKEAEIEPGYETLLQFRSMETENARPPNRAGLVKGLRQFVNFKQRWGKPFNTTQAFLVTRLLRHLIETSPEDDVPENDLTRDDLRKALEAALHAPARTANANDYVELSKMLYEELKLRDEESPDISADGGRGDNFELLLMALTKYGAAEEAMERLDEHWPTLLDERGVVKNEKNLWKWTLVLQGLAREGKEKELLQELQKADAAGAMFVPAVHKVMVTFFARQDKVSETKQWFEKPIHQNQPPEVDTYTEMIRFSVRNNQQQWSQPIVEKLMSSSPTKPVWDVLCYWAVLAMDRGVEDARGILMTMKKEGCQPDSRTITRLLKAAIDKKNPQLAEAFLSVGSDLGIKRVPATYILQMHWQLDANDLSGAHTTYQQLQDLDGFSQNNRCAGVLNKYLRLLSTTETPDMERILDVTAELEQHRIVLDPDTVVALCLVFLHFDKQHDVVDTLSLHTVLHSLEERAKVSSALVEYCLNPKTSTARVWDVYSLLRQFFPELEPEQRVRLMESFFKRKRSDMASYIFGHMRSHGNPAKRPTADMYVRCLEGLGRYSDSESTRMVHNMLKMDTTVPMNTRMWNALMIAYRGAGDISTALEFWGEITNSAEGPSYNSLAIVFWVCEDIKVRDNTARTVWQKIQRMDLDVPAHVHWAYCGALAGQGNVDEVKRVIQGMEASVGYGPGHMTLGVTYNALPGERRKKMFEDWAKQEYPEIWARLETTKGRTKTMTGSKFNITREMMA
ncbi:hypothetical protein B0T25DRAFT_448735 [Lasiosphaeria hispida]|uniref:Complex I intermediate-associated protein 84 n=1 Tax=Lasiosphaeria hispida TaxID=260671 RepID=A0AAJ0MIK8_9PEZI|nr:hypothetical protein B0T25DRAFT_448735 [Lasiosphaeria hispida]